MAQSEYRVRAVTRYVVTHFQSGKSPCPSHAPGSTFCRSEQYGEFPNKYQAVAVARALHAADPGSTCKFGDDIAIGDFVKVRVGNERLWFEVLGLVESNAIRCRLANKPVTGVVFDGVLTIDRDWIDDVMKAAEATPAP